MPTYTIVDKDTDPLGPNEIASGGDIFVNDGDVFVIATSANDNITFNAAGGIPADFDVSFEGSNANTFDVVVLDDLNPTKTVPDSASLSSVNLNTTGTDGLTLDIGNSVSFGTLDGAIAGPNTISIGNDFSTGNNWVLGDVADVLTVGNNATFENLTTGDGGDNIVFGDDLTYTSITTGIGNDSIRFGDNLSGGDILTLGGDDAIYTGKNASVTKIDGGDGTDTHNTESPSARSENIEATSIVCFAKGTRIAAQNDTIAVEDVAVGSLLETLDRGLQPVRWVGSMSLNHATLKNQPRLRPVCISAGALAPNVPSQDLFVSPQHRMLVRSRIARRMFGQFEVFIPAKFLVGFPGITQPLPKGGVAYFHVLLDQHEVLLANGAQSESLHLGPQTLNILDNSTLLAARNGRPIAPIARLCLGNRRRAAHLLDRHLKNNKQVVSTAETV